jgi:hypothetical protein
MFTRDFIRPIILLGVLMYGSVVYAAPSYTVTPLVIDEEVEVRDILERKITITNTGDTPVTIYPTVNNISIDAGGSIQQFQTQVMSDQTTSLAAWIEIGRGGINLMAGEVETVKLTLRINPNAAPGVYHAFVGFPYGGNRDEAERMVARGDAPGVVVTTTLDDTRLSLLKLSRFIIDRFVTSNNNSAASYTITNPGDEPLVPTGDVIFYNSRGEEIGALPVNPDGTSIPPGGEQVFESSVPTDGLFGKYKAFLSVEYGTQNVASVQDTTFFYIFPIKTVLIVLALMAIIVIVSSLYVHRTYFDDGADDGSELLPVHVRESVSDPRHHDIDLRES